MTETEIGIAPAAPAVGVRGAIRVWERHWKLHSFYWRSDLMGAVVQPLLYLMGMGLGVGSLVDSQGAGLLDGVSYLAFVAPAVIAAAAMNVAAQESVWPLMAGFKWSKAFQAMCATPITAAQVAGGTLLWLTTKVTISTLGVGAVLMLFPATRTVGVLAAIPAGIVTGLAYGLAISAWTATRESDTSFPVILRFFILPMFLFAGVFFPVDQLPDPIPLIVWAVPLWHGVELSRGAVIGGLDPAMAAIHIAILLVWVGIGFLACTRTFARRLTP
jgi:lipooligosaccharide transport system permease protein